MARKRHYLQSRSKIARLPHAIREQLHVNMHDGWPGEKLLAWLNGQKEVRSLLGEHFEGRPITQQNLSVWRHGHYAAWLRRREDREALQFLCS
jgi:hypothetical protein